MRVQERRSVGAQECLGSKAGASAGGERNEEVQQGDAGRECRRKGAALYPFSPRSPPPRCLRIHMHFPGPSVGDRTSTH